MLDMQREWCMIRMNGRGFEMGVLGAYLGVEPLTLMRYNSCGLPWLYETLAGQGDQAYNLRA